MSDTSQQSLAPHGVPPAAALVEATARWLAEQDDLALGCECANPALQIERWSQEAPPQQRT